MKTGKIGQNCWEEEAEDCGWKEVYAMNRIEVFLEEEDREIERLDEEIDRVIENYLRPQSMKILAATTKEAIIEI